MIDLCLIYAMQKPAEKRNSASVRQIRPPPLSQHLREFAARPDAWTVLVRNLIPVVGIYVFSWSVAVAVFNYWFDGLTAVAAIVAAAKCSSPINVCPSRNHSHSSAVGRATFNTRSARP